VPIHNKKSLPPAPFAFGGKMGNSLKDWDFSLDKGAVAMK
jgi:hypothetical protein